MSALSKFFTTIGFVVVLLAVGTADAALTQNAIVFPSIGGTGGTNGGAGGSAGVRKAQCPDVFQVFKAQDIDEDATDEESLLRRVIDESVMVDSRVLLKDNDRLASFSWTETADVKTYFTALKEALQTSFSNELQDLVDESQEREGKPVRNVLSFLDPAIHEDRLLFVRVRQCLYEFHVAPGRESEVEGLMDALTE